MATQAKRTHTEIELSIIRKVIDRTEPKLHILGAREFGKLVKKLKYGYVAVRRGESNIIDLGSIEDVHLRYDDDDLSAIYVDVKLNTGPNLNTTLSLNSKSIIEAPLRKLQRLLRKSEKGSQHQTSS